MCSMKLKDLQKQASDVFMSNLKRDNIKVSEDYLIMKLGEELGEFIQSYIVHKKQCRPEKYLPVDESKKNMAKELSDVLGLVLTIASHMKIDVEEALIKKWITKEWVKKK